MMVLWYAYVKENIETTILGSDDANDPDSQTIPVIDQELVTWLVRPQRMTTRRK